MFTRNGQKIKIWNIALLFFFSKFQPSRGSQKIRFKLHPGHLTCDFPSPRVHVHDGSFYSPFSSFRGLVTTAWVSFVAAMFSEVRWKFEKNKHRLQPNLTKKKKQSFARKFVGCFFLRMEGGSKPGELSVEMGCHLEGDISASAPRLVKISRLNSLRSATMARLLMALGVAMMAP